MTWFFTFFSFSFTIHPQNSCFYVNAFKCKSIQNILRNFKKLKIKLFNFFVYKLVHFLKRNYFLYHWNIVVTSKISNKRRNNQMKSALLIYIYIFNFFSFIYYYSWRWTFYCQESLDLFVENSFFKFTCGIKFEIFRNSLKEYFKMSFKRISMNSFDVS